MSIIRKLDQKTTNLIAAGEVIERCASVVKELVENAIDAQAKSIQIKLIDSGLNEIIVSDDGLGMDPVDAKMSIESHATSKINDGNDLFRIRTLGFRGEALPSIVAVSNFKMKTSHDGVRGLMYSLRGGQFTSEAIVSHTRGTEITVKNLFFNTPARLQSIQSPATELSYITEYIIKMALANPDIAFTLINNQKEILKTYGNQDLLEVIMACYGSSVAKHMIDVFNDNGTFQIKGYISKPQITRSTRNHMHLIVNGRSIRNYALIQAVIQGYDEWLMGNRYPIVIINVKVDPGLVDVNVHPAKLEVRFSNEKELLELLRLTIHQTLSNTNLMYQMDETDDTIQQTLEYVVEEDTHKPTQNDQTIEDRPQESKNESQEALDTSFKEDETDSFVVTIENTIEEKTIEPVEEKNTFQQQQYTFIDNEMIDKDNQNPFQLPKMSYIGQLHGTYILAQAEDEFFIIDQHAAAERINYEKILDSLQKEDAGHYELLVPIKLDFTSAEAILVSEKLSDFAQLGIVIEDFGSNSFMIREIPLWIPSKKESAFIEEIIMQTIHSGIKDKSSYLNHLAKELACKKSIKANEFHNILEIEYLLEDLAKAKNPYSCPHGRPTIIKFTKAEIEKWFKRIL